MSLFYHSFPRSWAGPIRDPAVENGKLILKSIVKHGLLLTPELVEFFPSDAAIGLEPRPNEILQVRFCFTQLRASEVILHSQIFGPITLEFDRSAIDALGAFPVIYVPQRNPRGQNLASDIGESFVTGLRQIGQLLSDMAALQREVALLPRNERVEIGHREHKEAAVLEKETWQTILSSISHNKFPLTELAATVDALSCLFYPVGPYSATNEVDPSEYYKEREWRIISEIINSNQEIDKRLTKEERELILEIQPSLESQLFKSKDGLKPFLDCARMVRKVGDQHISHFVRRIIVPNKLTGPITDLVEELGASITVTTIEEYPLAYANES